MRTHPRGISPGRALILAAYALALSALIGCSAMLPHTRVILEPTSVEKLPEPRPWLFLHARPPGYMDYMVDLNTPDGRGAYLIVDRAVLGTYTNALDAFFHLSVRTSQGADQYAVVDFEKLRVNSRVTPSGQASGDRQVARLTLGVEHHITIYDTQWQELESIPVKASLQSDVTYSSAQEFTDRAGQLMSKLLAGLERRIFDWLMENDAEGKYIYHFERR